MSQTIHHNHQSDTTPKTHNSETNPGTNPSALLVSSFIDRLPLSVLEELAATRTVEEVKTVLTASQLMIKEMNLAPMRNEEEQDTEEETPNQAYRRLQKEFANLENQAIVRIDAAKKYGITDTAISNWEKKGWIRVIEPAKRRGMPTMISERDVAVMAAMVKKFQNKAGPIRGWKPPTNQKSEN
jgi:hypothetical protein